MKRRVLAAVLSLLIVFAVCPFAVTAEDDADLKFAVASDLHYTLPGEQLEGEIEDDIYWYANRRAAMEDESGFIIDEFLNQCARSNCDYVLISGDIVDDGRRIIQEHYDVASKFAEFEKNTGKSIFVIDGNHDLGDGSLTDIEQFKEIYAEFGYDKALTVAEDDCSYTADLGAEYRLIALDSCDPTVSTEDGMSLKKLNWVRKQCKQAQADGRYVILMMHHNLLDHLPLQRIISRNFIIRNHFTTAEFFANSGIKIVLTGHEHCSDVATYTSALGNVIYDFATTSLTMYPLGYRVFTLTDETINYESKTIESIDTDALSQTVNGYSEEQLALMNEGLNSYAKGFLKEGVRYRLELSLSMDDMGIAEEAIYYDLVKELLDKLTEFLDMPLYGDNSVQTTAAGYSISLPETEYANLWELATEFVAAHYAGSEDYSLESAELKTLLLSVAVLLREELGVISPDVLTNSADALLGEYGLNDETQKIKETASLVFGHSVTPSEYFITALISPLLYEFISDSDGVDDNNGVLSGYANVSLQANTANIFANIRSIFVKLSNYFCLSFSYISKMFNF